MPHSTFLNLPQRKQDRIIRSAIDEFLSAPYEKTSINRIVENADIPKGSFYQYFPGKDDLYAFCIIQLSKQILEKQISQWRNGLLKTILKDVAAAGLYGTMQTRQKEATAIIGKKRYLFYVGIINAPRQLRNEVLLQIAGELYQPIMRRELEEDPRVRKDVDLDYYAHLLSLAELVSIQYSEQAPQSIDEMSRHTYEYIKAIYTSICIPDGRQKSTGGITVR
ncbi:MAG: TetR/AcrR family transcriptional regulator [Clostridiales Family XIII bacterium]|jgi:AcrR family transcriptional regulator|nr:TetR/AcrR family transcriptional regulator [Clostridiales Family XIII bacterium]